MNAKTRLWVFAAGAACVAVLLLGVFGGLMPHLVTASGTDSIAQSAETQNEVLREQIAELEAAGDGASQLQDQYAELVSAIPITADTAGFLNELQQLQTSTGATVANVTIEEYQADAGATESSADTGDADDETGANVARLLVQLDATGTQQEVTDFVRTLQAGPRFVLVNDVEITGTVEESRAQVTGYLFSLVRS